ncbi:hypothetical protein [Pseudoxanthomonas sp.]|uniref:DUF6988 family protein n=1 Tax=Pseudoxanthomonas sp. TaxID=1871049 RepID=UPI0035B37645
MDTGATPHLDLQRLRTYAASFDSTVRIALQGVQHDIQRQSPDGVVYGLTKIALEHGSATVRLFHDGNETAAYALVRLQYEAVLRACWINWAAPESWVVRATGIVEGRKDEGDLGFPPPANMIEALSASARTPQELAPSLDDFKSRAWVALNSFSHGGFKSIIRALYGHEPELTTWMIKSSCTLSYLAAMTCAAVSGKEERVDAVCAARVGQSLCFHPLPKPGSE